MTAHSIHRLLFVCVLAAFIVTVGSAGTALGDDHVSMAPHKIVLNAQGNSDDVQAIIGMSLPSATIVSFDAVLSFDGVDVSIAESAFYCAIDDNLIVGFDRTELQNNPDVAALAGQTVVATVEGQVTVQTGDTTYTRNFIGSDSVEILKPGRK